MVITNTDNNQVEGTRVPQDRLEDRYRVLTHLLTGRAPAQAVLDPAAWEELVRVAQAEDVAPLLNRVVREQPDVKVPAPVQVALSALYKAAAFDSLRHESVRTRVCCRLAERGVPVLLLKGAALAFTCYDDPATRLMSDLDLLVPRSRLLEAARALEEDGFRPYSLPRSLLPMLNRPHLHLVYVHPRTQAVVELHWEIQALRKMEREAMAEIWAHSVPVGGDTPARMMGWGHMIPLLCAHMSLQHQHATLLWLYDLHRVLAKTDEKDARLAREAATRWRLAACTAHVLLHVRELFGTPLPAELATWAAEMPSRGGLQKRVTSLALAPGAAEIPHAALLNLLLNGDWRFLRSLFPAPEVVRERLDLAADQGIAAAYLALMARRLRQSPTQMRRLWRCWRDATRPDLDNHPRAGGSR
jgi:hypothetical protein